MGGYTTNVHPVHRTQPVFEILKPGRDFSERVLSAHMEIYLPWFGGPTGIDYIPRPMFLGTEIGDLRFGLLILAFVVLIVFLCFKINHSWIGLAWECIRLDEETAQIMGINVGRYKLLAFVVGGLFSGLGGALYSTFFRHICPEDFSFIPSLGILATVLAGGTGTILGPVAGAILFTLFPEFF